MGSVRESAAELRACDTTEAQAVAEVATRAAQVQEVYKGERRMVVAIGGKVEEVELERVPTRQHQAMSVESLVSLAVNDRSVVWHNDNRVKLIIDNTQSSYREDYVQWSLTSTEAYTAAIQGVKSAEQKAAVELLANKLRKPVRDNERALTLLAGVRNVNFQTLKNQTGSVDRVTEAVGRSVSAELVGADNLPEEVVLTVQRWADLDFKLAIELCVTVDVMNGAFTIAPTRDEAVTVELQSQYHLAKYLREKLDAAGKTCVPVFAGVP